MRLLVLLCISRLCTAKITFSCSKYGALNYLTIGKDSCGELEQFSERQLSVCSIHVEPKCAMVHPVATSQSVLSDADASNIKVTVFALNRFAEFYDMPSDSNLEVKYDFSGYMYVKGGEDCSPLTDALTKGAAASGFVCSTQTTTGTSTATSSLSSTATSTQSSTGSTTGTSTATSSISTTATSSHSATATSTATSTATDTATTATSTATSSATSTGGTTVTTSATSTVSSTATASQTSSATSTATTTVTSSATTSPSSSASTTVGSTVTTTPSNSASTTITSTPATTESSTAATTESSTATSTATDTATSATTTATTSISTTATTTPETLGTSSFTSTATSTASTTKSYTQTTTQTSTASTTATNTATTATSTATSSQSATASSTGTTTASTSATSSATSSPTTTKSHTRTSTQTSTASTTATNTATTATSTATSSQSATASSTATTSATSTATTVLESGLVCSPKGEMTIGVTESKARCEAQANKLEEALATCDYLLGEVKPELECAGKAGFYYLSAPSNCKATAVALNAIGKVKGGDIGVEFIGTIGCGLDKFLMQATECGNTATILTAVVDDVMKGAFDLCQTTSQTTTVTSSASSTVKSTLTTTATTTATSTLFPSSLHCSTVYGTVKGFGVGNEESCIKHKLLLNEALDGCPFGSDGKAVKVDCARVGRAYILVLAGSKDCNGLAARISALSRTARVSMGLSNVEGDVVGCAFNTYLYSIPTECSSAVDMVNTLVNAHVSKRVSGCAVDPTTSTTTTEHLTTTVTTKSPTTTVSTTASTTPSTTPATTQTTSATTSVSSTATTTPTTAAFSGGVRCNAMYGSVQAVGIPSRFNCSYQVGILNAALNGCPAWNAKNPLPYELSCQATSSEFNILRSHFMCGKTASAVTALADQVGSYILGSDNHGDLGCLYDVYLRSMGGPAMCSSTVDTLNKAIEMQMRGHLDPCWMLGLTTPTTTADSTTTSTSTSTSTMDISAVKATFVSFVAPPTTLPTTLPPSRAQVLVVGFTSPHPYNELQSHIVAEIQSLIERLVTGNSAVTKDDIVSIVLTTVNVGRKRRADYYLMQANVVLRGTVSASAAAAAADSVKAVLDTTGGGALQLAGGTTLVVVGVLASEAKDVLLGGNTAVPTIATTSASGATVSTPNIPATSTISSSPSSFGAGSTGGSSKESVVESSVSALPSWSIAVLLVVAAICIVIAAVAVVSWRKAKTEKEAANPWSKQNKSDSLISGMLVGPTPYMDPVQFSASPDPHNPVVGNFTGWDETVNALDIEVIGITSGTGTRGTVGGSSDFDSHYYNMPYAAGGEGEGGHMLNVPETTAVGGDIGLGGPSTHFYPGGGVSPSDGENGDGGGMFGDYASDDGYADESGEDESMVDVSEKAREIFSMFDTDQNGDLSSDEMARMVRSMQHSDQKQADNEVDDDDMFDFDMLDPETIAEMLFMEIEKNGDGDITLDEFVLTCEQPGSSLYDLVRSADIEMLTVGASRKKAKELYQLFDTDGNGDLSIPEVSQLVNAMIIADSGSLTAKELSSIDSMIVAEILRLEFDRDGDGVVTLDEFIDRCCNQQGMMAELVTFTSAPGMDPPEHNPGRDDDDAKLAAKLRRRTAAAASSVYNKYEAEDAALKIAERQQHQSVAAANLRLQQEDAAARASASANLALSTTASKALGTASASAALFGDDPELSVDPTAGKSKIWLALNPQPLARQTAAERRAQQEADEEDADEEEEEAASGTESEMGFGSDESDFSDSDEDFDDDDLEIDPAVAARLEANRKKRDGEEKQRASDLAQQHGEDAKASALVRAEEMKVIEARQQIERRESKKEEEAIVAQAQKRMATELQFDFTFFAAADADGDGMLSLEEAKAQGMSEEMFRQIDADGNGQLTQEEFEEWMKHGPPPAAPPLL